MTIYGLSENNSGGSFWLTRKQYDSLIQAGWYLDQDNIESRRSGFLSDDFGSTNRRGDEGVPYSWRDSLRFEANSLQEAVESFESATGEDFFAEGCNCCGCPFTMYSYNDDGTQNWDEYW